MSSNFASMGPIQVYSRENTLITLLLFCSSVTRLAKTHPVNLDLVTRRVPSNSSYHNRNTWACTNSGGSGLPVYLHLPHYVPTYVRYAR